MLQLAIEILSPKQGLDDILAKFKAYFALSIKFCWLIIPTNESITVYSTLEKFKTFGTNDPEVTDETLDIHLSIPKLFGK
jgi:Uma2 family endonuclease